MNLRVVGVDKSIIWIAQAMRMIRLKWLAWFVVSICTLLITFSPHLLLRILYLYELDFFGLRDVIVDVLCLGLLLVCLVGIMQCAASQEKKASFKASEFIVGFKMVVRLFILGGVLSVLAFIFTPFSIRLLRFMNIGLLDSYFLIFGLMPLAWLAAGLSVFTNVSLFNTLKFSSIAFIKNIACFLLFFIFISLVYFLMICMLFLIYASSVSLSHEYLGSILLSIITILFFSFNILSIAVLGVTGYLAYQAIFNQISSHLPSTGFTE